MYDPAAGRERLRWSSWPCPRCNAGLSPIGILVRGFETSGGIPADEPEKLAALEISLLQQWASRCPHGRQSDIWLPKIAEGSDHAVFFEQEEAVVFKATRPGTFGETYYIENGRIHQRNC
jgi:hypothetical protein